MVLPSTALSPADGAVVSETLPAKPLTLLAAMIVVHVAPGVQFTVTGLEGEIVKSLKMNVVIAEWDSVPLMPVVVTTKVPAIVDLHVTVAVPEPPLIVEVDEVHVGPAGTRSVRVTVPVKPFSGVTVIVETAAVVPSAGTAAGEVAVIVKSTTWKRMVPVECDLDPLVPVTTAV